MEKNVGGIDRSARLVVGPLLILVSLAGFVGLLPVLSGVVALVVWVLALVVGAVFVVTGYTQKCPLNNVLGLNTYEEAAATESTDESGGKPKAQ